MSDEATPGASRVGNEEPAPIRLLAVANKKLPERDYRIQYGRLSERADVSYALPGRPSNVPPEKFFRVEIGEGLGPADVPRLVQLAALLWRVRDRFDAVHFFSTKLILAGPPLARLCGLRSVITVTGFGRLFSEPGPLYRLLRLSYMVLLRLGVALSSQVLVQNTTDLRWMRDRFPGAAGKIRYLRSGVSNPPVERSVGSVGDELTVLLVCRLLPLKGVGNFLDVARSLHGHRFRFILVGPPARGHERLHDQVRALDSEGVIEYRGQLEEEELWAEYFRADVFWFPSRYAEGLPRVMLEAGLAGLCPVAADLGANRDLIEEGRGFLLPPGDTEAVEELLRELAGDRERLRSTAAAYEDFVRREFTLEAYRDHLDRAMETVASVENG